MTTCFKSRCCYNIDTSFLNCYCFIDCSCSADRLNTIRSAFIEYLLRRNAEHKTERWWLDLQNSLYLIFILCATISWHRWHRNFEFVEVRLEDSRQLLKLLFFKLSKTIIAIGNP